MFYSDQSLRGPALLLDVGAFTVSRPKCPSQHRESNRSAERERRSKRGCNSQVDTISHGEMSARDAVCPAKPPPDFKLPSCCQGYGGHPRRRRKKAACGIFRATDVDARGPHNELIRNREEREGVSRKIMSDEDGINRRQLSSSQQLSTASGSRVSSRSS